MTDWVDQSQKEQERILANKIKSARRAHDAINESGDCVICGVQIDAARLKALPEADRCLPCQHRLEGRNRTHSIPLKRIF